MPAVVVVFDPERTLPPSFAADATFAGAMTRVGRAATARHLARRATVVVIVTGSDVTTTLGFLASVVERRGARLVLFVADAGHRSHLIIRALRRGAIVLMDRPPSVLVECVCDLIAALAPPRRAAR
jgi:hypothetical protein